MKSLSSVEVLWICTESALCGVLGGVLGKCISGDFSWITYSASIDFCIRLVFFVLTFTVNSISLQRYVVVLKSITAFKASAVCFALSTIFSSWLGFLAFGETFSIKSVISTLCMLTGIHILLFQQSNKID